MELPTTDVNARRSYDASRRQEGARRTRERILDTARDIFLATGYAASTIPDIAAQAGVSPETVYKAFGNKPGVVRALYERALGGTGPVKAYLRSDEMRLAESDPRSIMRKWGDLTAEVISTVAPILILVRAAASTDPSMAALLADSNDERLERMRHNGRFLADRGFLRSDVTESEAVDVLWLCSSTELYELMVLSRGWALQRYAGFVADLMMDSLLPREAPEAGS
jgi:AcrR family transcriptional regulator